MSGAEFSVRLRDLGVSNAWLARKLGKAPHTVGKWAHGELRVPEYVAFVLDLLLSIRDGQKKWTDLHEND